MTLNNKTITPIFLPNKAVMFKMMRACLGVEKVEDLWISLVPPGSCSLSEQSPLKDSRTNLSQDGQLKDAEQEETNEHGGDFGF